jgi:hypothetical protein
MESGQLAHPPQGFLQPLLLGQQIFDPLALLLLATLGPLQGALELGHLLPQGFLLQGLLGILAQLLILIHQGAVLQQ